MFIVNFEESLCTGFVFVTQSYPPISSFFYSYTGTTDMVVFENIPFTTIPECPVVYSCEKISGPTTLLDMCNFVNNQGAGIFDSHTGNYNFHTTDYQGFPPGIYVLRISGRAGSPYSDPAAVHTKIELDSCATAKVITSYQPITVFEYFYSGAVEFSVAPFTTNPPNCHLNYGCSSTSGLEFCNFQNLLGYANFDSQELAYAFSTTDRQMYPPGSYRVQISAWTGTASAPDTKTLPIWVTFTLVLSNQGCDPFGI